MTPEQRASALLTEAAETGLLENPDRATMARWHSLIASSIIAALREARELCDFIPDRIAIGELMVGPEEKSSGPGVIECIVCDGSGKIGSVPCGACNGRGIMADSGPMPDPSPGEMAFKPQCGCATDWFGAGSPPEYQEQRRQIWQERGWRSRPADFKEAGPLITAGAGCHHEQVRP